MKPEIDLFTIKPEDKIPGRGKVLISEPFLPDTFFNRTVVYLTEHTEMGSVGLILNKMINIKVNEAIEGFLKWNQRLTMGGPVAPDTLHYLHTMGDRIPNSTLVSNNIFWGGDIEVIRDLINAGEVSSGDIRFFLGYSGWGEGQLESELLENSWVIGDAATELIMDMSHEDAWKSALMGLKKRYQMWTEFPESPEMN
jgi:putative transcriptional regulator